MTLKNPNLLKISQYSNEMFSNSFSAFKSMSRSFSGQVHFYFSLCFYCFYQSFLSMLFSYFDHLTGFYLCFSYLSILLTIFSPITVILQVFNGAFLSQCDELTVFNSSHIFSLDSVCIMGSCVNGEPIPSLLSVYRPRANHYHNRDRVLSSVKLSYPIETLITKRKPSDDGLYGQYSRNAGLKPGFGNYCHARVIETGHSPGIPIPGLTISCKNEPANLIQVKIGVST